MDTLGKKVGVLKPVYVIRRNNNLLLLSIAESSKCLAAQSISKARLRISYLHKRINLIVQSIRELYEFKRECSSLKSELDGEPNLPG